MAMRLYKHCLLLQNKKKIPEAADTETEIACGGKDHLCQWISYASVAILIIMEHCGGKLMQLCANG